MSIDPLIAQLKRDEGYKLSAYPDPLTHADPWTIGYGHTGPEVHEGLTWTQEQCDAALIADIAKHDADLDHNAPWSKSLDDARRGVLRNMIFNISWGRLSGFKKFLLAVQLGDYRTAAQEMLDSLWAHQIGSRAQRLSQQMLTGEWV